MQVKHFLYRLQSLKLQSKIIKSVFFVSKTTCYQILDKYLPATIFLTIAQRITNLILQHWQTFLGLL